MEEKSGYEILVNSKVIKVTDNQIYFNNGYVLEFNSQDTHLVLKDENLITLEEIDLSVFNYNILKRAKINVLQDILDKTDEELLSIRNINERRLHEIKENIKNIINRREIHIEIKKRN